MRNLVRRFNMLLACVKLLTRFYVCSLAVILEQIKCWRIVYIMEREKTVYVTRRNKMHTFLY